MADALVQLVKEITEAQSVPFTLVCAVIEQESDWNRWAYNPEPKYRWVWDVKYRRPFRPLSINEVASPIPPKDFTTLAGDKDQEWWAQRASWGLMQIMGAAARENGFSGLYLTEILDPRVNLLYGCLHLKRKLRRAGSDIQKALQLWNGGGDLDYYKKVLARESKYAPETLASASGASEPPTDPKKGL